MFSRRGRKINDLPRYRLMYVFLHFSHIMAVLKSLQKKSGTGHKRVLIGIRAKDIQRLGDVLKSKIELLKL